MYCGGIAFPDIKKHIAVSRPQAVFQNRARNALFSVLRQNGNTDDIRFARQNIKPDIPYRSAVFNSYIKF